MPQSSNSLQDEVSDEEICVYNTKLKVLYEVRYVHAGRLAHFSSLQNTTVIREAIKKFTNIERYLTNAFSFLVS